MLHIIQSPCLNSSVYPSAFTWIHLTIYFYFVLQKDLSNTILCCLLLNGQWKFHQGPFWKNQPLQQHKLHWTNLILCEKSISFLIFVISYVSFCSMGPFSLCERKNWHLREWLWKLYCKTSVFINSVFIYIISFFLISQIHYINKLQIVISGMLGENTVRHWVWFFFVCLFLVVLVCFSVNKEMPVWELSIFVYTWKCLKFPS